MIRFLLIACSLLLAGTAAAQQTNSAPIAWDGLGQDPNQASPPAPARTPSKPRVRKPDGRAASHVDRAAAPASSSHSWTLESSVESDPENQRLKRSVVICRGC
jgi:hypothetical protein